MASTNSSTSDISVQSADSNDSGISSEAGISFQGYENKSENLTDIDISGDSIFDHEDGAEGEEHDTGDIKDDTHIEDFFKVDITADTEEETAREEITTAENSSSRQEYAVLLLLGLVEFVCGVALSVLAPFYTREATSHGLSVTASCAVFSTVFILQIVFTPIFGRYINQIGSVRLLIAGAVCSGLSNVGFGLVANIQSVELFFGISILMRAFTALGESAINTAVYPLARSMTNPKYSSTVLSCMETTFGLGTMMGPFFGGLLYDKGGFSLPFLVCGVFLGFSGTLTGLMIICHNRSKNKGGKNSGEEFVVPRIKFRKIIKRPGVLVATIIVILSGMSTQWYQPTLEPYLYSNFKISSFKASIFLVIDGAVYALVSPICGVLLDKRLSTRLLLMFGCTAISISFLLLGPLYFPVNPTLTQIGVSLAIHGLGMAANFIGTLTALSREIEKGNTTNKEGAQGMSTSIWITAECIGSFLGSSLGGLAYEYWGWTISCLIISVLQLAGLVLVLCNSLCLRFESKDEEKKRLLEKKPNYGSNNNIV